jgi:hypothetical protein
MLDYTRARSDGGDSTNTKYKRCYGGFLRSLRVAYIWSSL